MPTTNSLATALNIHPIVAAVLAQRGLHTVDQARAFLNPDFYTPASPFELPDADKAATRLAHAIQHKHRIRIWGDFDVDGQTSTSVLVLGLRSLGADVSYTIPNRAFYSHGLNKPSLQQAKDEGINVLLTCDCGVTDFEEIAFANTLGIDVLISDHHDLAHDAHGGMQLPNALAIVNPKRLPSTHPLATLPGVGVAYKLIEALTNISPHPTPPQLLNSLLGLVALGIVADVAEQKNDTRYLLQRGLQQLRRAPPAGIAALLRSAKVDASEFDSDTIGFQIGPRLNAAGRLDSAELSVALLTSQNMFEAQQLADKIETLNNERKQLQRTVEQDALNLIEREPALARHPVIVLQSENWHPSVVGVVANAVVDKYQRPALLISVKPGEIGRGSGRSVAGIDIHAAIAAQSHLIEASGGHPMAAGFGIRSENVAAFRAGLNKAVSEQLAANDSRSSISDSLSSQTFAVAWREADLKLAEQLELLAPFGNSNPRPLLRSDSLKLVRHELIGNDGKHRAVYLQDASSYIGKAVWWRGAGQTLPEPNADTAVVFNLRRNTFAGKTRAQAEVVALDFAHKPTITTPNIHSDQFQILDFRGHTQPNEKLRELCAEFGAENVQVFCEPSHATENVSRLQLCPLPVLVMWSAPPDVRVLKQVLATSKPRTVAWVCALASTCDTPETFMRQLLGMVKASQKRHENADDVAEKMAARIGHTVETVQEGIACFRQNNTSSPRLVLLLEETRAYRKFLHEAAAEELTRVG